MRQKTATRAGVAAGLLTLSLSAPAPAQSREYYVKGRVLDVQKQPVVGVEIRLRDVAMSRSFDIKTDKQGTFKFAGLPHGIYEATFVKDGYASKKDQWKFEAPQDSMQRVEVPDVVLATQSQVQDAARVEQAASGLKDAAEKLKKRDVDGAIALLKELLARDPRNQGALFLLGMSYAEKKMCREAVDTLTPAIELNPALPGAYFALGVCHKQLGDPARALESYDKGFEQDPKHADSAYNAGLILFESSRIEEAQARFERVLALKPADADAFEMLGRCDLNQGRFAAAVEHLEKARAASSDHAKIAFLDELLRKVRAQVK